MGDLVGGKATFYVNGNPYSTNGEFDVKIQNVKREGDAFADGGPYFTEMTQLSTISGAILLKNITDTSVFEDATDVTVIVELRNGRKAVLRNAFFSGDMNLSTTEGTMSIEFSGVGEWLV